jgi:hypothetical protein
MKQILYLVRRVGQKDAIIQKKCIGGNFWDLLQRKDAVNTLLQLILCGNKPTFIF